MHAKPNKIAALFLALASTGLPPKASAQEDAPILAAVQSIKFSSLIQIWYVDDETVKASSDFRLRRAELVFSGKLIPSVGWSVMIDPALTGSILKDLYIAYKNPDIVPGVELKAGQFKVPFGMEGFASSGKIDTVERSLLSTLLKWSDFRDMGAMAIAQRKLAAVDLTGTLGVFSGQGPNTADVNNDKDVAGRLTAGLPQGAHLGGSFYKGTNGPLRENFERYAGELAYLPPQFPLMLKAETAVGHQGAGSFLWAYYVLAGYTIREKLQPIVRWDVYGANKAGANTIFAPASADWQREITFGLNYFIKGHHAKVQTSYTIHRQDTVNGVGDVGGTDRGIFRLASQIYF